MMLMKLILVLETLLVVLWMVESLAQKQELSRGSFPKGFVFGTASSSYQVIIFFDQVKQFLSWILQVLFFFSLKEKIEVLSVWRSSGGGRQRKNNLGQVCSLFRYGATLIDNQMQILGKKIIIITFTNLRKNKYNAEPSQAIALSFAGKVIDFSNADVAVDHYHLFHVIFIFFKETKKKQ